MSKRLSLIIFSILSFPSYAGTLGEDVLVYPWFGSIGTGYSWTEKPGIVNPNPAQWAFSAEGYDADLGNRGFYSFALGKQVHDYIDVSISYLVHEVFNYQKFQTAPPGISGPATGDIRTRYFDLDNRAILVNGFLHPMKAWSNFANVAFTPFIGGGIGYAYNEVRDFHTVARLVAAGVPIGSITSIGNPASRSSFAWQASAGVSLKPQQSHFSVDVGYRYYDGGKFEGSSRVFGNADGFVGLSPWEGRLKANQAFVEFKYTT
ncbi:outer membrane protein [Legionella brunensis]|uniref:outer membrane protein n=1 Tax=Legionella brunensis TaxID=29422 RepID=UPI0007303BB6|nr:outer membrane beta-barrel protein [Legionella brunensis]